MRKKNNAGGCCCGDESSSSLSESFPSFSFSQSLSQSSESLEIELPKPDCVTCVKNPCYPFNYFTFRSIRMTFSIDDSWTKTTTESGYQCTFGQPCYRQPRLFKITSKVQGMSVFNGTYDIGYYKSSIISLTTGAGIANSSAVFTEADPKEFPCHFWFFPLIQHTINYSNKIETITGDPASPCAYSVSGPGAGQSRTATLVLSGGGILLNPPNTPQNYYATGNNFPTTLASYTVIESRELANCIDNHWGPGADCGDPTTTITRAGNSTWRIDNPLIPLCFMWNYRAGGAPPADHYLTTIAGQQGYMVPANSICAPSLKKLSREIPAYSDTKNAQTVAANCIAGSPPNMLTVEWTKLKSEITVTLNA
jgi:hypothetical protein